MQSKAPVMLNDQKQKRARRQSKAKKTDLVDCAFYLKVMEIFEDILTDDVLGNSAVNISVMIHVKEMTLLNL